MHGLFFLGFNILDESLHAVIDLHDALIGFDDLADDD